MFENVFNGMFGKIDDGMCRLSMTGKVAVKTKNGYKSYDVEKGRLTNCSNFVFPVGGEFFFCIPTNKVEVGDIILIGGKPKCVIKHDNKTITVLNYEDSTVDTVVPERHVFMGSTYFYGKIVSLFSFDGKKKNKGMAKMLKYMMMSEMFGGTHTGTPNGMSGMLPLMLMGNGGELFDGMFDGIFDADDETAEDVLTEIDDGEEEAEN